MPTLDAATVKALIDAAHRSGKLAIVHATWPGDVRMAVESGADGLAHLWVSSRGEPGDDAQLVRLIKANNIFVVPTLTMIEALTTGEGSASLLADARLTPYLTDRAKANLKPARAGSLTDPMPHRVRCAGRSVARQGRSHERRSGDAEHRFSVAVRAAGGSRSSRRTEQ